MRGNSPLDNPANLLFYARERKSRSRILKSVKVTSFVDQQSRSFVGISFLESFEADSGKISHEMRDLLQENLGFVR